MSATNYRNRWVDMGVNSLGAAIIALGVFYGTSKDVDARELKKKVDNKADKTYVDKEIANSIREHEKVDAARYKGISDMFNIIREEQAEMRNDIKEILKNQR